jgi:hypothetical protein
VLADPEKTNAQAAKSNNPDTGEVENEATEANFSERRKARGALSDGWMVKNWLGLSIGRQQHIFHKTEGTAKMKEHDENSGEVVSEKLAPGPIARHL